MTLKVYGVQRKNELLARIKDEQGLGDERVCRFCPGTHHRHCQHQHPSHNTMMRKGKIAFSWADDGEEDDATELNLPIKPPQKPQQLPTTNKLQSATTRAPSVTTPFDVSQIRDRVLQMEMGEELVVDGSLLEDQESDNNNDDDDDEKEEEEQKARLIKQAKETRAKLRGKDPISLHSYEEEEEQQQQQQQDASFIPVNTSGQYWLKRDFEDSEEAFHKTAHSRLVREDLVNDRDDSQEIEGFTRFGGGRLSKRLLERDLKSAEFYDTELLEVNAEDSDEEVAAWQAAQARKGFEKGWRTAAAAASAQYDTNDFLARQSKLAATFAVPKQIDPPVPLAALVEQESARLEQLKGDLQQLMENCDKMRLDAQGYDFSRFDTSADRTRLVQLQDFSAFLSRWIAFMTEREDELDALAAQFDVDGIDDDDVNSSSQAFRLAVDAWEHFFDDIEPEDFLNLPAVCTVFKGHFNDELVGKDAQAALVHIVGFFCKYHLLRERFPSAPPQPPPPSRETILEESGLQAILDSLDPETRQLIQNKL